MKRLDPEDFREGYEDWLRRIEAMHEHAAHQANPTATLHRPKGTQADWRVGLLTTAGAYVEGQEPFDVSDPLGDSTFRAIPDDVELADLRFAHSHYDTTRAEADPNVVLPLVALHAMVDDGAVGGSAPAHVGMMGWNPDPTELIRSGAPAVVDHFTQQGVDVVVMSPG